LTIQASGSAKLILKVIDEKGQPLENALVRIAKGGATKKEAFKGKTNSEGYFSKIVETSDGIVGGAVIKDGYYKSNFNHSFFAKKFGRWQPWEKEITVIMRPIINQIPMYISDKWITIPELDKEIGFDLIKSDWIVPYGKGEVADFVFYVKRRYENIDEFEGTMILSFSNEFDGILEIKDDLGGIYGIGSIFRLPRFAPKGGYISNLKKSISAGSTGWHNDKNEDSNYIFRIRSKGNENEEISKSIYGKILGDIVFDIRGTDTADIKMRYYLNPDGTRNLEFDPERNLFRE